MEDPDPKCRHFVTSWHFMAFWHLCQKANCITKSAFPPFSPNQTFRLSSSSRHTTSRCKHYYDYPPAKIGVNIFLNKSNCAVLCPQIFRRRPQFFIRDRTFIGFLAKVQMFPLFGKQLEEITLLYMNVFCENQKTDDKRIK